MKFTMYQKIRVMNIEISDVQNEATIPKGFLGGRKIKQFLAYLCFALYLLFSSFSLNMLISVMLVKNSIVLFNL